MNISQLAISGADIRRAEKRYPEIGRFKVDIFPNEGKHRGRPHCRVITDQGTVTVDINTGEVLAGNAGRLIREVLKEVEAHRKRLLDMWNETRPDDQQIPN